MNFLLKILDNTEKYKTLKILYYLLLPIFYLLEYICFVYFWKYVILKELLTKESVVNFFDENEFGYKWYKLYKKDIIEPEGFMNGLTVEEISIQVKKEFTSSIIAIINDATIIDIENFLNLTTFATIDPETKIKQYDVTLRYYRTHILFVNFKFFILWLITIIPIVYVLMHKYLSYN